MAQRIEHGNRDPRRVLPRRPLGMHPAAKIASLEVIGDDIHAAFMHPDVVHGHDPGVPQLRESPCFLLRPFGVGGPSATGA